MYPNRLYNNGRIFCTTREPAPLTKATVQVWHTGITTTPGKDIRSQGATLETDKRIFQKRTKQITHTDTVSDLNLAIQDRLFLDDYTYLLFRGSQS